MLERGMKVDADLLAGIEDVQGIEEPLHLLEKSVYLRTVHLLKERTANKAVVVLGGRRALVAKDERIDLVHHLRDDGAHLRILKVHKRDDVEVSVAGMARDGVGELVLVAVENGVHLRQEFRHVLGAHDEVIHERSRILVFHVAVEQFETLPPDGPVFFRLRLALRKANLYGELFERRAQGAHPDAELFLVVRGKLDQEHDLREPAAEEHEKLGKELPAELDDASFHKPNERREEPHRELERLVVVRFDALGLEGQDGLHELRHHMEILRKYRH